MLITAIFGYLYQCIFWFFSTLVTSISSPAKNSLRLIPTMLWSRRRNQPVPEFFAVDKALRALLLCAVKGGVSCHQTSYLQFSRFNLSLFLRLHFFITHLTLPFWIFIFSYTLYWQVQNRTSYFGFLQKLFFTVASIMYLVSGAHWKRV